MLSEDPARALFDANKEESHSLPTQQQQQQQQQQHSRHGAPALPEAVAARVPGLQRLPELTLDELAHAQECYTALLGERKECISNAFELRVLLGQLGLYPSEDEMALVVKAARQRVNFSAFTHYLRFCKREYEIGLAAGSSNNDNNDGGGGGGESKLGRGANSRQSTFAWGSRGRALPGDADTLRAFVALGGGEDGSGEIGTATLAEAVRSFQLTIDIAGMIANVDYNGSGALDYGEFCRLWAIPEEQLRRNSLDSIGGLHPGDDFASPQTGAGGLSTYYNRSSAMTSSQHASGGNGYGATSTQRQTALPQGPSVSRRDSNAGGRGAFSRRKSSLSASPAHGAQSPHGGGGGGGGGGKPSAAASKGSAPALQPLSEEDRLLLLHVFLMPEQHEPAAPRKARLAVAAHPGSDGEGGSGGNAAGGAAGGRLPPLNALGSSSGGTTGAGGSRRVPGVGAGAMRRTVNGRGRSAGGNATANSGNTNDAADDIFSLQKSGNGVYQPPSPMILFQRSSAARRGNGNGSAAGGARNGATQKSKSMQARGTTSGNNSYSNAASAASYAAANTTNAHQQRGSVADRKNETY